MTPQEVRLWVQLKYLNRQGFHFRRQAPIDRYIVDFVEFGQRLVIEVDGSQHGFEKGETADRVRDEYLTAAGFRVLRFWNNEVDHSMDGVIDAVQAALTPIRLPRPKAGGATFPARGKD
jgi:very-short-patch-repair endonuclease